MRVFFQSIGIFIVLLIYFLYFHNDGPQNITNGEAFITIGVPIVYVAFHIFLILYESRVSHKATMNQAQRAQEWRARFDNSKDCQFFLSLVKHMKPASIHLTHTQPATEKDPTPPPNRLYPQAKPAVKPFTPCIQLKDAKNTVIFSSAWPWDFSVRESMDYFYDWLSYHLPADLSYNRYDNTNYHGSVSSKPSMYTMKETVDGRYIIYDSDLDMPDSKDSPSPHYGYILYKKKTQ